MRSIDSGKLVAAVRANLDELAGVDVSLLPDQCVRDELLELVRAANQVAAQIAARVATFDARGLSEVDGCRDVKAFLHAFGRVFPTAARPMLARGRLLRQTPQLAAAAARGEVSVEHLKPVLDLVDQLDLPTVASADAILASVAATGTVKDVATACRRIRALVDPDGPPPDPDKDHEQRFLSLTRRDNHIQIRGRLDLESGAAVITALDALMRPPTDSDQRTPTQRRADALGELALTALNHATLPEIHSERPHLGLLITPKALTREPNQHPTWQQRADAFTALLNAHTPTPTTDQPGTNHPGTDQPGTDHADTGPPAGTSPPQPAEAWLNWVGEIPIELAQRLACDADVWRAVLDPATSLPLDVGRAYRVAPYWMRRALHARDRGCRFPGCTAAPQWTDAHHLDHWIRGGRTRVEAMILLCRYHHRMVHEGGWRIHFDDHTGEVTVWRPDGRPYELGPSQPWTGPTTRRAA